MRENMKPSNSNFRKEDAFFAELLAGQFRAAALFFAIMVALSKNQHSPQGYVRKLRKVSYLIKEMRHRLKRDPIVGDLEASYGQEAQPGVVSRLLISFWSRIFGIGVKELCRILNEEEKEDSTLRRAFGLSKGQHCHPQRISEFHRKIGGKEKKEDMHQHLREMVCELLNIDRLSEADVELMAATHSFDPQLKELGKGYGFDYFLSFVFWQGILAKIEATLEEELKPNGYSVRDLCTAYLSRLDEVVKTQSDLEAQLRNEMWSGEEKEIAAPVGQTLSNFLLKLELNKLIVLYQGEIRRSHRGKKNIVVAIDAVLLELFGKKYEGAGWHWDHKESRAIFGYKMHVIFSVTTGEPIAFYLHQEGDKDADVLDKLVKQARSILGLKKLGIVLFDKGYWRMDEFRKLVNTQHESMVTPAKRYKDVKKAIAGIKKHQWHRIGVNQRCAETSVHFGEHNITFRLMAWKKLGRRALKDKDGNRLRDAEGKVMTEPVIIIHSYLTNLSELELEADQLLGMYGQRWGIEDCFEELQNQYYLAKPPGTSLKILNRHIILTFLLYILVQRFQKLAADWLGQAKYALMELRRFGKEFLRAPIAYLLWLKAGKPKEQARRSTRRSGAFLGGFFDLEASP
jgi:hypothetical protein